MKRNYLVLVMILFAFGCATATSEVGRKFDASAVQKIEVGKTTESEVLALLGEPTRKAIKSDGTKLYGYSHIKVRGSAVLFVGKSEVTGGSVVITFDKNGIVSSLEKRTMPD